MNFQPEQRRILSTFYIHIKWYMSTVQRWSGSPRTNVQEKPRKKKQTPKRAKNMNVYDKLKNIETVVIVPKPRVQTMNAWNEDNTHFIIWFIRITFQCLCLPFRYLSAVLKWQIDIKLYQWLFRYCDRKYQHTVKFLTSECKH